MNFLSGVKSVCLNEFILHWEKKNGFVVFEYTPKVAVIMLLLLAKQLIALPVPSYHEPRLKIKGIVLDNFEKNYKTTCAPTDEPRQ